MTGQGGGFLGHVHDPDFVETFGEVQGFPFSYKGPQGRVRDPGFALALGIAGHGQGQGDAELDARAARAKISVYYPELEFCTDNGAMIALAGALRFQAGKSIKPAGAFAVRPRWPLAELTRAANG